MSILSDLKYRLRAIFRRNTVEDDLGDELRFHIEQETEKYVRSGVAPDQAARRARLAFGPPDSLKEGCRDARGVTTLETAWRDVRYALRGMRRAPVFASTVILTIALGIGVNTAAFTIFNAYLLRPIPVDYPVFPVHVHVDGPDRSGHWFTWQEYQNLGRQTRVFSSAFAARNVVTRINGRLAFGELVTRNYFQVVGVGAARGRTLTQGDGTSEPGAPPLVVLSHTGWTALFGGDPAIVGTQVRIGVSRSK